MNEAPLQNNEIEARPKKPKKPKLTPGQEEALRTYRLACALSRPAQTSGRLHKSVAFGRHAITRTLTIMKEAFK